ncbi:FKBP12-rapamycin complex-associated protein [Angomonas deanei]|nr:FKBP12-rapamycin complex-associated protein [Angomonas deanei]|eukprot:EPY31132.1 FKBP12-rapamycin complex-associated protein [Angomonas deanei]
MDLQQLAVSIRNVAEDPQRRETFVKTGLIEIKRLQRENSQLLEKNMSYLLNCLESFNVVDGPDADILCELTVLRILLGADLSSSQKEQCNSYVKLCLDSVRTVTVAVCAADVFAETLSYSIATDFLRTTVEDALQWMSLQENKKNIGRKVCGILILTEVALRLPMAILQKLGEIFDKLWDCLASSTGDIRARALRLFTLSTKLLCNRPTETRNEISASLMKCLKTHLNSKLREKKIAGLLAFEPIVINSTGANSYSLNYEDLSLLLVPFIVTGGNANSFPEVRALVFRCLVVLCRFNTTLFVANQLKDTVRFVLDSAKREDQMGVAFDILSEIVSVVGKTDFEPFVDECCTHLMNVFEESNPENPCWEALKCFATICKYCPPQRMKLYVDTCVDHIFSWRLSTVLVDCMRDIIAASDPTHQAKLEESLLDMISVTLCRLPFRQQGGVMKLNDIPVFSDVTSTQISVALNALVQFGFSDSELMGDFLRDSVLPLIDNSSPEVRSSAIKAIVSLLIPKGRKGDLSIGRRMCINTVLFRLLVVGLSDPSETIRTTILTSFTADFYPYLSEQQFLFRLFSALGDESIECRVAVLSQLCHMMTYDLSHILPALREEMVSILNSIHATFNPSIVEGGLRMLTAIASAAPQFINQYGDGVPDALRKHFSSINTQSPILLPFLECCTAVSKAIRTFGKRKNVFKYEIHYIIDLLDAFGAGTSLHQQRLGCLGFLSATLSPLIDDEYPYAIYPKLFPLLSSIIKQSSEPTDIRLEALRCVGAIGALDPHTFESTVTNEEESESNEKVIMFGKITHEKCCGVVLWSIASTLEANNAGLQTSTSSDNLVRSSLQTILRIADTCRCSWPRLRVVMAPLAKVIIDMSSAQRSERLLTTCLYEYSTIVYYVGDDITSELKSVYLIFDTIWNNHVGMRCLVVRLLSFLSYTEKGNQATKQSMRVLPQVFDALTDPPDRFNVELKYVILKYIVKHAQNLQSLCAPLVNSLLQSLRVYQRDQDYIHDAITALKVVCSKLYIEELVGVIVRTLLVCLAEDRKISTNMEKSTAISNNILGTFSILILELQSDFLKYSAYINQTLKACKITSPEFTALNNEIASGAKCVQNANATQALAKESARLVKKCENIVARYLARRGGEMLSSPNATVDLPGGGTVAEDKILVINEARILSSIKSVPLTREEWMKWSEQFSISILQESPYRVFRCTSLAIDNNSKPLVEISPYFTRNVLEVGFRTVWTYGSMSLRTSIVEFYRQVLRQSMSSSTVPDEVLAIILSIVEYMDHMGEVLSLEYSDLSDCAWSRGMLAKALYWREAAYRDSPAATVESLISLYSELEFVESSVGLMNLADEEQHKALLQSSLVKLARYTEALKLTKQELEAEATVSDNSGSDRISKSYAFKKYRSVPRMLHYNNNDSATSFGGVDETGVERRLEIHARLMLCLSELGNYHEVLDEWKKMYAKFKDADATDDGNLLFYLSQYAADASTRLQQWDTLEQVIPWMTKESVYYHIANATLQIVNNNFDEAVAHVADGRTMLLTDLSSLLHESYARAYTGIVVAQELTELEEVAAAKRCEIELGSSDHVHVVSRLWQQRIRLMSANVTVWKQILGVRGLLIPPKQDVTTRVRFVKLCRQEGASDLERFTLQQLIGARNPTLKDITSRSANLKVVMQWVTLLSSSNALGEGSAFGTESELLKRIIDTHYKVGQPGATVEGLREARQEGGAIGGGGVLQDGDAI